MYKKKSRVAKYGKLKGREYKSIDIAIIIINSVGFPDRGDNKDVAFEMVTAENLVQLRKMKLLQFNETKDPLE